MTPKRATPQQDREFRKYFGTGTHTYLNPFTGFDVIAFDEKLGTPDGVSTAEFIEQKHGAEAVALCLALISL